MENGLVGREEGIWSLFGLKVVLWGLLRSVLWEIVTGDFGVFLSN